MSRRRWTWIDVRLKGLSGRPSFKANTFGMFTKVTRGDHGVLINGEK